MILTEEQRAAIKLAMKYIARWPFAYKELHARGVLQAMIDSSEHIREPPKMVGFDLERARGLRDFLQDDCAEVGDVWAEMIAEIERLRAALDESERILAHKTKTATHWYEEGLKTRADLVQCKRVVEQQAARIEELEDALVEMVATNPCNIPTLCDVVHDELMCLALDGNCDFWKGCPQKNELRKAARKQLQSEGKIGPDAKPHCWQITEERKAAIKELSELLTAIGCPSCHYYIQKNYGEDITVLRAMLTEAE